MGISKNINNHTLSLVTTDITDFEVEAFVFYAREDLQLGTGFGNAISMRGGLTIQKALDVIGKANLTDALVTEAGNMKAKYIVHAVGPKFQEPGIEDKLKTTIFNSMKAAEEKGIKQLAFPSMGAGFYGIPLPVCADIMVTEIKDYLENSATLEEVIICALDKREYNAFKLNLDNLR
ncbi:macro domain-containing protein [bacterium]|nr:macro domain-containing protein [bacterium]